MKLNGLHLLLTYQCTFECDHCFAWGSPWQNGTMTLDQIRLILSRAQEMDSLKWIFFEGGEPFLYYPVLVKGVQMAAKAGFQVGIVSNAYWATSLEDALEWLKPLAPYIQDLSVSSDLFHYSEKISQQASNAAAAAETLGIPVGTISIARPDEQAASACGQLPDGESKVMYRGRAAQTLVEKAVRLAWDSFPECPHENLREPGRVHLDPLGYLHICQGISIGNIYQTSLIETCAQYDPDAHPIIAPLLAGGPTGLVKRYQLAHEAGYADACHLCYTARTALRSRFPEVLLPDQMYGVNLQ
jgi:organic radical activating enzyme